VTTDNIFVYAALGLLYLAFAAMTAMIIYTMTVNDNDLNETQRKITLARAVLASLVWPVFWVFAMAFLLYRGVRFVLRYGFRSMESDDEKFARAEARAAEQLKSVYPQEHVDWINGRFEERK